MAKEESSSSRSVGWVLLSCSTETDHTEENGSRPPGQQMIRRDKMYFSYSNRKDNWLEINEHKMTLWSHTWVILKLSIVSIHEVDDSCPKRANRKWPGSSKVLEQKNCKASQDERFKLLRGFFPCGLLKEMITVWESISLIGLSR